MVTEVTSSVTAQLQHQPAAKPAKTAEPAPVVAKSGDQPTQSGDLLFKPGNFKDNEAFAIIAEAGAEQGQKQAAGKNPGGSNEKYAKNAFDIFSVRQTSIQRHLQALLSLKTIETLNQLISELPETSAAATDNIAETSGETPATSHTRGGSTGTTSTAGSTETTGSSGGGGGDSGSSETETGETTTTPGNGKGHGKGGVKKS